MEEVMQFLIEYSSYVGLPLLVAYITQGLKIKIPFFNSDLGLRIVHFIPVLLGVAGGFLLPVEGWQESVLTGGGLGCVSLFIYKFVTVTFASKTKLAKKIAAKELKELKE